MIATPSKRRLSSKRIVSIVWRIGTIWSGFAVDDLLITRDVAEQDNGKVVVSIHEVPQYAKSVAMAVNLIGRSTR